jgi:hypothetical protein
VKWCDAKDKAWLFGLDGRGEVHLAFEPIEREIARRLAFQEYRPSRDSRSELIEALTHHADGCSMAALSPACVARLSDSEPVPIYPMPSLIC